MERCGECELTISSGSDGYRALSPVYARKYKSYTLDPKMGTIVEVRPTIVFGLSEKDFKNTTRWMFGD